MRHGVVREAVGPVGVDSMVPITASIITATITATVVVVVTIPPSIVVRSTAATRRVRPRRRRCRGVAAAAWRARVGRRVAVRGEGRDVCGSCGRGRDEDRRGSRGSRCSRRYSNDRSSGVRSRRRRNPPPCCCHHRSGPLPGAGHCLIEARIQLRAHPVALCPRRGDSGGSRGGACVVVGSDGRVGLSRRGIAIRDRRRASGSRSTRMVRSSIRAVCRIVITTTSVGVTIATTTTASSSGGREQNRRR